MQNSSDYFLLMESLKENPTSYSNIYHSLISILLSRVISTHEDGSLLDKSHNDIFVNNAKLLLKFIDQKQSITEETTDIYSQLSLL